MCYSVVLISYFSGRSSLDMCLINNTTFNRHFFSFELQTNFNPLTSAHITISLMLMDSLRV